MESLLGSKLLTKSGEKSTAEALGDVDVVGIYFSAHWCPPCRGFTPTLADFHRAHAAAKNFQIVFASSDSDEKAFSSYYGEMPWLALPYSERDLKEKLSKKYKVSGIPSLVFVDAKSGEWITTEGRAGVSKGIESFPYKPRTFADFAGDAKSIVVTKQGDTVPFADAVKDKKYVAFYFSAHWCSPCRQFSPELSKWHETHKSEEFELLFVSADKGQKEMNEYHAEMPFPAMAFDSPAKDDLMALYDVGGYPTLVVIDAATGKVVCGDARGRVSAEPNLFPWPEKAVEPLEASLGNINDVPLAILLMDKADNKPEVMVEAYSSFEAVAEETFGAGGAGGAEDGDSCADGDDEDCRVRFAVGRKGDESAVRLREFFGLNSDADGSVRLFVSDIPSGKKFVYEGAGAPSADQIREFIVGVKAGKGGMGLRDKAPAAA